MVQAILITLLIQFGIVAVLLIFMATLVTLSLLVGSSSDKSDYALPGALLGNAKSSWRVIDLL